MQLAEGRGVVCGRWFDGLPLQREQIVDPTVRISYRTTHRFIQRALRTLQLPNAGLLIGKQGNIGDFGLLGLAMLTSQTMGGALKAGVENYRVCGCLLDLSITPVNEREVGLVAWLQFNDLALQPFFCEELFGSCLVIARKLVGPSLRPAKVELSYPATADADEYAELFQCPIEFNARSNRMLIEREWLDRPIGGHNPLISSQALTLCAQEMASSSGQVQQEIVVVVERLLRDQFEQRPRLTDIAHMLHLSDCSLRRKLAENGRVFRDIYDQVRTDRALHLLRSGQLMVAEIGVEIGFDDPRKFRQAFKRWTGVVPKMARLLSPGVASYR